MQDPQFQSLSTHAHATALSDQLHQPYSNLPVDLQQQIQEETEPFIVVRALYDYRSEDAATISLAFQKDDLIQVVAQLESGWWYGFCNENRGWFPSNFVEEITQAELEGEGEGEDADSESDEDTASASDDLWLTQATPDGQVFYLNTRTQDKSWTIPTPSRSLGQNKAAAATSTATSTTASTVTLTAAPPLSSVSSSSSPSIVNPRGGDHVRTDVYYNATTSTAGATTSKPRSSKGVKGGQELVLPTTGILETSETESRSSSTRPNSWQASAVPTRAGSPLSQDGSHLSSGQLHLIAGIRKPSSASAVAVPIESVQGLPPLPLVPNPFESEPTWASLAEHTASTLQNLVLSAEHGYKSYYQIQAAQVVESIRMMLYASGTVDKDAAPIRQNRSLKVYHRQIMAALSRLVLSAKMASSVWPVEGAVLKMQSDAGDVANSVHQFITMAQEAGVTVHDVDAKLILDPEGPFDSRPGVKQSRSLSNASRISLDGGDKNMYRRSSTSTGVQSQLDYYCKSITKATGVLALQVTKALESIMSSHFDGESLHSNNNGALTPILNSAQSSQLVLQCQQTISQIGSLLTLVSEYYAMVHVSHPSIKDHIFLDVRVSKQALYNNLAALMISVQSATDTMAQTTVLEMTLEAIQNAERSVIDLASATRSLAVANEEVERQDRARVASGTGPTLVNQASFTSLRHKSNMDDYFLDHDFDLESDTAKNSHYGSDSRFSYFSTGSSISAPTTSGTEYTGRSHGPTHPLSPGPPASPIEITPSTASRPAISITQKEHVRGAKLKKMLGEDAPTPKPTKVAEVPWFLGHDYSSSDISFNMEGHVRGGTLPALVERLTLHDGLDPNFVATFLLTYRSFTTTAEFFSLLFRRSTISPPEGLDEAQLVQWTDRKLTPIRLRVFNIIKSWLEHYYLEDEPEDRQILPKIKEFADSGLMRVSMSFVAVQLIKLVEKRETLDGSFRKMVLNLSTQAPQPITPRNLKRIKFLDLDPLEFARQLTIMEANCYNKIKPVECLAKAWTSEDPEVAAKAVNIKKMIETSNLYANWINEILLNEKEVKKRVAIIRHVVSIAERLRQLNNFSMLSATTAALAQSPVHRLKRTWELVPSKTVASYTALQAVTAPAKNWGDYRQELHSANPPCVPFVGVYLTDLVMIQDGNPDTLKGTDHHINFYKRVSTAEVIREIQQYQSVPYCLTVVPEIQAYIRRGLDQSKSVTGLYDMSLALEPSCHSGVKRGSPECGAMLTPCVLDHDRIAREDEEEKITRLLSESGFL
ncbi:hypothetical protein BGZ51_003515 [Haplosporangium sp. Z 767]|nr:hypothetical protein BGZ51_003515 [Haplosporangium sp. Z 767]